MSKKVIVVSILIIALTAAGAFAQEKTDVNVKQEEAEVSPGIAAVMLAQQLAEYGYRNESPESLIVAAQILVDNPTGDYTPEEEETGQEVSSDAQKETAPVVLDPEKLLQDAKSMGAENEAVMALAAQVESRLGEQTRGLVDYPGGFATVRRVEAGDTYSLIGTFQAGEVTEVGIQGDGDTDIDCYVFDENKNLIASDSDNSAACYLRWMPKWTGKFAIVVNNTGRVWSEFLVLIK